MPKFKHKPVVGGTIFVTTKEGVKSAKIIAQSGSTLTIDPVIPIEPDDICVIHADTKSQLFRTVSITENTEEKTYTISAISHDPAKYNEIDSAANFPTTTHKPDNTSISNITVIDEGDKITVGWDGTLSGSYVSYDIKLYRNGVFYRHIPDSIVPNIELTGLSSGTYRIEIRGRTAKGSLSEPYIKSFDIDYSVTGFRASGGLLCIQLFWVNPQTVINQACTEIFVNTEDQLDTAQLLVSVPYPTSSFTVLDVKPADRFFYWARFKDETGVTGEFTSVVEATCDQNPQPILDQIHGSLSLDQFKPEVADGLLQSIPDFAGDDQEMAGDDRPKAGKWDVYSQITSGDYALTKQLRAFKSQVDQNSAAFAEQISTLADAQHAEGEKITTVAAQVNEAKAQVTEVSQSFADLNGKLSATWQMQVSVDDTSGQPIVGGVKLGVDSESGKSEFVVQSDKFAVWTSKKVPLFMAEDGVFGLNGDLVSSGTISGKTLIGNELRGGQINGGSLNIGQGRFVVDNTGNVSIRDNSQTKRGLVITSQNILVYDSDGNIRVVIGYLYGTW